jgi:Protein of unknown function (DUF3800)
MALKQFVYADESGTHDGSAYCLVAGFRGSPGQWDKFNKDWRAVLLNHRVPEFHSKIFYHRKVIKDSSKNPYINWPDAKADQFLGQLLKAITARGIHPVGCAVNVADFESYTYGERCVLAGYETQQSRRKTQRPVPYHLAFRTMLGDAMLNTHPDTALHFIFALQEDYQQRALEVYQRTKELGQSGRENQLRGIGFETPADWPGLQAADLLAHHWYNSFVRTLLGRGLNRQNIMTMNILTHKRREMPTCNKAGMERLFADVGTTGDRRRRLQAVKEPTSRAEE